MKQQLFFYCNAVPDDLRAARRLEGDSPAATRKVIGLCCACRAVGIDAQIVSMGRGRVGRFGIFGATKQYIDGIPMHVGPMVHVPLLSHLVSMLWLAWIAFKLSDRRARQVHLFYNQLTFYVVALAVLRMLRQKTAVDIEDGPVTKAVSKDSLARARFGANVPPSIFARLISSGALLANSALAEGTNLKPLMPYYGSIASRATRRPSRATKLRVMMSGSLEFATGAELLADALKIIDGCEIAHRIEVTVTGSGSAEPQLHALVQTLKSVRFEVLGRIKREQYDNLLMHCDVGLSLKLPGLGYSDTTFPSKTVEYAENGMLLICTDISDVRSVFGDAAWYITANDPQQLADLLLRAAIDPAAAREDGLRGQQVVIDHLSFHKAGTKLRDFFFGAGA